MPKREMTRVSQTSIGSLCVRALIAGALIGGLQGLVGYIPRSDSFLIALEAAIVGALVAMVLAVLLYKVVFRSFNIYPIFTATAWVSGVLGVLSAIVARWWTYGEGATISVFVTPAVAFISVAAIRAYIGLARPSSGDTGR